MPFLFKHIMRGRYAGTRHLGIPWTEKKQNNRNKIIKTKKKIEMFFVIIAHTLWERETPWAESW